MTAGRFCSLFAASILVAFIAVPAAGQGRCTPLEGTITGQFDFGSDAWVGQAYLSFNGGPVISTSLVDNNAGYKEHPMRQNFAGYEILTFTANGGSTFQMSGQFIGVKATTPYAYAFSETGKIIPETATGAFEGMTGSMSIHGSFVAGDGAAPWLWIAEITGSACKPK
jgi:hypothetical protein